MPHHWGYNCQYSSKWAGRERWGAFLAKNAKLGTALWTGPGNTLGWAMQAFTSNPCQRTAGSFEISSRVRDLEKNRDWRRSHCTAAHSSWGRKQTDTHKRNQGDAHQPILLVWLGGSLLAVVQLKTLCPPSLRVRAETQDDYTASFLHLDTLQVKGGTPISYVGKVV